MYQLQVGYHKSLISHCYFGCFPKSIGSVIDRCSESLLMEPLETHVLDILLLKIILFSLQAVLDEQKNASFIIIAIFIIFCTTATLCLVFVPKVI